MSDISENKDIKREGWLHFLQQARDFRKERLERIEKGGVWKGRSPGPYCVMHWISMPYKGRQSIDIEFIRKKICRSFIAFPRMVQVECRENSDGLLIDTNLEDKGGWSKPFDESGFYRRGFQYAQIFHSGAFEAVYAPPFERRKGENTTYLNFSAFEFFRWQIKNCIRRAPALGFSDAGMIGVSILGVKGYSIHMPVKFAQPFGLNEYLNPAEGEIKLEQEIPSVTDINDVDEQVLRPILNEIWEHFGLPETGWAAPIWALPKPIEKIINFLSA